MDVLNTTGGDFHIVAFVFGICVCVFGLVLAVLAMVSIKEGRDEFMALIFGIVFAFGGALLISFSAEPIRLEVTLRPGYVIDAEKYEIVEQRGKIYVIEEREVAE